jgi:hypothetical protein
MAATFKTQAWDSTGWGWDSSAAGSPVEQMCSELSSWITTVNGNATQSGKQLVLHRDETDSTTTNYRGFTIEAPAQNIAGSVFFQFFSNTTTSARAYWGNSFTDDTSNGGYGTISSGGSDTGISFRIAANTSAQMQVAYGTVDGEEYFYCGWIIDSSSTYGDCWGVFKDQNGEWVVHMNDGTSPQGWAYDPVLASWRSIVGEDYLYSTTYIAKQAYMITNSGLSTGDLFTSVITTASDDIFVAPQDTTALTYFPYGATGDYLAKISHYGPYFRYTPV